MSANAALVLIDLQKAIDDPSWGARNHPHAERRAARLLALWRHLGWPIFHIRHDSREPNSTYRPGQPLHDFKPETAPLPHETVLAKNTCSAFASTDLAERVRAAGIDRIFVCGVITNNSVEATVRAGGDLGFRMYLAEDACFTFGKGRWSAEDIHEISLQNLDGEYCAVTNTVRVISGFLESLYGGGGQAIYPPANCSYQAFALRAAAVAKSQNANDSTVLAALLMDIGHLLEHPDARHHPHLGVLNHAETGAAFLRSIGFSASVTGLIEEHSHAIRYLSARPGGFESLSPFDQMLVNELGGPLSGHDADVFADRAISFTILMLRNCEEQALLRDGPVPPWEAYRTLIENHLGGPPAGRA